LSKEEVEIGEMMTVSVSLKSFVFRLEIYKSLLLVVVVVVVVALCGRGYSLVETLRTVSKVLFTSVKLAAIFLGNSEY